MLDALPEHFDPDYAPRDILNLLSAWLGVDLDESQPIAVQRDTIRRAAELAEHGRSRKGQERLALFGIEAIDRVDETETAEAPTPLADRRVER